MNWEAIGAVAELIGALGVVASLFYLAVQIRRNSDSVEAATASSVSESSQQRLLAVAQSPELAEAFRKLRVGEELSSTELTQVEFLTRATVRSIENTYIQYRRGMVSSDTWNGYKVLLRAMARPEIAGWWESEKESYDSGFRKIVDHLRGGSSAA